MQPGQEDHRGSTTANSLDDDGFAETLEIPDIVGPQAGDVIGERGRHDIGVVTVNRCSRCLIPGIHVVEATLRETLISLVTVNDSLLGTIIGNNSSLLLIVEEMVPTADPGSGK